jgi:hypothetical protein
MELYQIIGQDSYAEKCSLLTDALVTLFSLASFRYEKAAQRTSRILDELRDSGRFLIVTPREGCSNEHIRVPHAHRQRVLPLTGYRDEMVPN